MTLEYKPYITRESVFQEVDEVSMFALFFGVAVEDILWCLESNNHKICNPLREDKNPSLGFKFIGNKLYAKDFAGYFQGDLIDLVGLLINKNPRNPKDFVDILLTIKNRGIQPTKKVIQTKMKEVLERYNIYYELRDWTWQDEIIWNRNKILTPDILAKEYVYPISYYKAITNSKAFYTYKPSDPCYLYSKGMGRDGILDFQLYFPLRDRKGKLPRFITNSKTLFGTWKYKPNSNLLLTKSNKDRILCDTLISKFTDKFTVLAIPSETFIISEATLELFKKDFNNLYCLYDNDRQGRIASIKYRHMGFIPTLLEMGKDPTGYCELNSLNTIYETTKALLSNVKDI